MTRNLTLTLLGCLTLVACGTPQEQCISQNTREYRVVSNLLRVESGKDLGEHLTLSRIEDTLADVRERLRRGGMKA